MAKAKFEDELKKAVQQGDESKIKMISDDIDQLKHDATHKWSKKFGDSPYTTFQQDQRKELLRVWESGDWPPAQKVLPGKDLLIYT